MEEEANDLVTEPPAARESILDAHRSRAGLWLALLGQEAMRRLRAAHTAHELKPRQFEILGLLHDHGGGSSEHRGPKRRPRTSCSPS